MCRAVVDVDKVVRVKKMNDAEIEGFRRIEKHLKGRVEPIFADNQANQLAEQPQDKARFQSESPLIEQATI